MSVFNPNDPNKTLVPQTGNRQTPYNIGGKPPYGFVGTPAYNPAWAPVLPGVSPTSNAPGGPHEVALYERFDWDKSIDARQYQNPAFVGIGSSGQVPTWMQGDGGVKRILRGYMRRSTVYPLNQPGLSDAQKATNARLYFMYNPSDLARQYQSFSLLAGQATSDTNAQVNGGQQVPAMVTMSMELLFDRQEEVARFTDHPGVLVDLAVFDMLIGNDVTSYDDVLSRDAANLNVGDAGATTAISRPTTTDTTSLKVGLDIYITIIMSPSLVFEGKVMEASALFQKFSHRMTPTRMTLSITLLLNYTGKLQPTDTINAAAQSAGAFRRDITNNKSSVDPTVKAASTAAALNLNYEGRLLAVQWAEQWTAEAGKQVNTAGPYPPAGTTGSYYSHSKKLNQYFDRCKNWANDDLVLYTPPHDIPYFDCSSLCYRALNVIGWADALHLGGGCPGVVSDSFIEAASGNGDVWSILDLKKTLSSQFNKWDPQNSGQPGPNVGDMLVRKGSGSAGHIAFIHSALGSAADDNQWKWKLLHSCCPDEPVKYSDPMTTAQIISGYTHIIRPHPIKS